MSLCQIIANFLFFLCSSLVDFNKKAYSYCENSSKRLNTSQRTQLYKQSTEQLILIFQC